MSQRRPEKIKGNIFDMEVTLDSNFENGQPGFSKSPFSRLSRKIDNSQRYAMFFFCV
jgi:hypothetical protein